MSGDLLGRDPPCPLCKRLFAFRVVVYRRFDCLPFTGFVLFKDILSYSFQEYIQSLETFVLTFPTFCAISTMYVIHTATERLSEKCARDNPER